jgi:AbrB family looped-hinge helix DNA binding protein
MRMAEQIVKVTRKGQVTIPVEQRRRYRIREGMKLLVRDSPQGILLSPVTPLEELAGADAGRVTVEEMKRMLDKMRSEDRY